MSCLYATATSAGPPEELNTTQPAISNRLAMLETELGCRLINRGDGGFSLTEGGVEALARFEAILDDIEGLHHRLQGEKTVFHKPLRIGAIDSVSSTWMPHMLESLHQTFPTLQIELTVDGTKNLIDGMSKTGFDVIFTLHPVLDDGVRNYSSCVFQMVWAGSPRLIDTDRTYSAADLAKMPIISFPRNSPPYQMIAPYFHDENALASNLTSCNSLYAIINLLIDGFGVGAIPAVTIRRELANGLLHQVKVRKRFSPMQVVASYQALTDQVFMRQVISQARLSAARFCASVDPDMAWTV